MDNMRKEGIMPLPSAEVLDEQFNWLLKNTSVDVDLVGKFTRKHSFVLYNVYLYHA